MGEDKEYYTYDEIDEFFSKYSGFFDKDEKKAIFLLGVLVSEILSIQYRRGLESKPFKAKLYGLKLDKNKIEYIFKEANQKLMEYDTDEKWIYPTFRKLKEKIAEYFVSAGSNWKLNNNEISYIFSLGMAMNDRFKNKGGDFDEWSHKK